MLRQQFDTRLLKCFIIKKKSVLFRLKRSFFIEVDILTYKNEKSLIKRLILTYLNYSGPLKTANTPINGDKKRTQTPFLGDCYA